MNIRHPTLSYLLSIPALLCLTGGILFGQDLQEKIVPNQNITHVEYNNALKESKDTQKKLLLIFHASWNQWSSEMQNKIYKNDEFKTKTAEKYIVLKIDIPKKELPKSIKDLLDKYEISSLPSSHLVDSNGNLINSIRYIPGSVDDYLKALVQEETSHLTDIKYADLRKYNKEYHFQSAGRTTVRKKFKTPQKPVDVNAFNKLYFPHRNKTLEKKVIKVKPETIKIKKEPIKEANKAKLDDPK